MMLVGLTGGIGSGKSTAAMSFARHGIPSVDADKIGHEAIGPGGVAERSVLEAFGETIITDGAIDRAKLGSVVFGDATALARLNALVHPAIIAEVARRCGAHAEAGAPVCIIDAALLGEAGLKDAWVEKLIVVRAPEELRLRRLAEGRGMQEEEARRRIGAQSDPEKKVALADYVIENGSTIEALNAQVDRIAQELLR